MVSMNGAKRPLLLGRYEVGKLLGRGNFAKVYYAKNARTGEEVAIKVMEKEKILKSGMVDHIKREIAVLRRVPHPNIVQLFEVMASKTKIYFVMEYVGGGELFHICGELVPLPRGLPPRHQGGEPPRRRERGSQGVRLRTQRRRRPDAPGRSVPYVLHAAPQPTSRRRCSRGRATTPPRLTSGLAELCSSFSWQAIFPSRTATLMRCIYRQIYKGAFRCPRWFSPELIRLLRRIHDTNPERRINIPEIMENRWFKKGFRQIKFYVEDDKVIHSFDSVDSSSSDSSCSSSPRTTNPCALTTSISSPLLIGNAAYGFSLPRPTSLNAFDIISFSPGFDLSGLFEERGQDTRFVSGAPATKIVEKLEEIASTVNFTVRAKDCQVSLDGMNEGEMGRLSIAAEIFELTPELIVVEAKRKAGDKVEYEEFCNKRLKPALQNLVYDGSTGKMS